MITDAIINILVSPLYLVFNLMPLDSIPDLVLPDDVFNGISGFLANVAYIIPINGLLPILILGWALDNFNIIWSLILRIKSFIPTMGR